MSRAAIPEEWLAADEASLMVIIALLLDVQLAIAQHIRSQLSTGAISSGTGGGTASCSSKARFFE